MSLQQILIYKINGYDFSIEISKVDQIISPGEIYQLPGIPNYIEGLINLRDKVYTVINLRKKFNFPEHEIDDNSKIIISTINTQNIGFLVDDVHEILKVDDECLKVTNKKIENIDKKYISSVVNYNDRIIINLDLSSIK